MRGEASRGEAANGEASDKLRCDTVRRAIDAKSLRAFVVHADMRCALCLACTHTHTATNARSPLQNNPKYSHSPLGCVGSLHDCRDRRPPPEMAILHALLPSVPSALAPVQCMRASRLRPCVGDVLSAITHQEPDGHALLSHYMAVRLFIAKLAQGESSPLHHRQDMRLALLICFVHSSHNIALCRTQLGTQLHTAINCLISASANLTRGSLPRTSRFWLS